MIEAVRRYDGYIVQSTGDGIFALFDAPVAHEDHPQRALYAALRLQDAQLFGQIGRRRRHAARGAGWDQHRRGGRAHADHPQTATPSTPRLDTRPISLHACRQ